MQFGYTLDPTMPAKRKYSDEQYSEALRLCREGFPVRKAAMRTGIGFGSLRQRLAAAGFSVPEEVRLSNLRKAKGTVPFSANQLAELKVAYEIGDPLPELSAKYGLSRGRLKHALRRVGAELPPEIATEHRRRGAQAYWDAAPAEERASRGAKIRAWWEMQEKARPGYRRMRHEQLLNCYRAWSDEMSDADRLGRALALRGGTETASFAVTGASGWDDHFDRILSPRSLRRLTAYAGTYGEMEVECAKGHRFSMRANNLQQGQGCPTCSSGRHESRGQRGVREYLESLGLDVVGGACQVLPRGELDVYSPSRKFAIEYDGLLWHSTWVKRYDPTRELRGRHLRKALACRKLGIALLAVYEDEWEDRRPLVEAMVRWRVGKFSGQRLHARSLQVERVAEPLTKPRWREFFQRNHLDGVAPFHDAFALWHGDRPVQVLALRRNFHRELEVARLATDYDFAVPGGAGRLVAAVRRAFPDEPLYTFSNNRLSSGAVYQQLGFQLVAEARPSYWYTDGATRLWRWRCRRVNSPEVLAAHPTEEVQCAAGVQSMRIFGDRRPLYRIEDYGHRKWRLG